MKTTINKHNPPSSSHPSLTTGAPAYRDWLLNLKSRFKSVQLKAAVKVNQVLLLFYWELGQEIIEKQQYADWGSGFLQHLSKDLCSEFPEIKGFSTRNLRAIRQWVGFYLPASSNLATACCQIEKDSEGKWLRFPSCE